MRHDIVGAKSIVIFKQKREHKYCQISVRSLSFNLKCACKSIDSLTWNYNINLTTFYSVEKTSPIACAVKNTLYVLVLHSRHTWMTESDIELISVACSQSTSFVDRFTALCVTTNIIEILNKFLGNCYHSVDIIGQGMEFSSFCC